MGDKAERRRTNRGTAVVSYWVWAERAAELSPFVGFSRTAAEQTEVIAAIAQLPSSVFELFIEKSRAGFARMNGASGYRVQILDPEYLRIVRLYPANPFSVFISNAKTVGRVEEAARRSTYPVLHVTTARPSAVPQLGALRHDHIHALYVRVLQFLEKNGEPEWVLLPKADGARADWSLEDCGVPEIQHGVTIPNETALKSMRFRLAAGEPLPLFRAGEGGTADAPVNVPMLAAIQVSVDGLRTIRSRFAAEHGQRPVGPPVDTIVWSSAVDSRLAVPIRPGEAPPEGLIPVLRALLQQRDYPALTNQSPSTLKMIAGSKEALAAMQIRKQELALSAAAIGLLSSGYFAPVVRVRPAVNLVKGRMKQLAACAVAQGPRRGPKLAKLAREIARVLVDEVGPECMRMIEQSDGRAKLIANAPLELLPIRDLPMQLRYTVSRVPITPAYVFLSHTIGDPGVYVSPADLSDVLIVRSFEHDDPIRHALEKASAAFLDVANRKLNIRIVDVASVEEFADAVNSFTGKILVFDGHGAHSEKDGIGLLELGGKPIEPGTLKGKIARMPPIVILSACSTHPLDWSETSSAGAFLAMGAMSVLGTVTPVHARDAAVFVGRLLLRLAEFVPVVAGSGQRWSDVISGLLRMSYVTDLIRVFERESDLRRRSSQDSVRGEHTDKLREQRVVRKDVGGAGARIGMVG